MKKNFWEIFRVKYLDVRVIMIIFVKKYLMGIATISKNDKDLKWTLISEIKSSGVDELFEIYGRDKDKGRIYYFLNKKRFSFNIRRIVLFERDNGDFKFVRLYKTIGISSTGKMYIRDKTFEAISYNKATGFYHFDNTNGKGGYIKQLTYNGLYEFIMRSTESGFFESGCYKSLPKDKFDNNPIIVYMLGKFGWLRYIMECGFGGITFNVINRKKLFNLKAMYRHIYGCPYPQATIAHSHTIYTSDKFIKIWNEQRKYLINIESLTKEFFDHPLFIDSCRMAQMVGKKVNCSWSIKRLKSEHDKWSKLVTQVILETEPLRELKVGKIFREFAEHSGFELLTTNHALLEEGCRMNHCVGTYSSSVDSGLCGIYRALDCTLEMVLVGDGRNKDTGKGTVLKFRVGQYMDIGNTNPPLESIECVNEIVSSFVPSPSLLETFRNGSMTITDGSILITEPIMDDFPF